MFCTNVPGDGSAQRKLPTRATGVLMTDQRLIEDYIPIEAISAEARR